jgi:hypothetical protein
MITEYLFLSPSGEVMSSLHEIRRYVEEHYADHRLCPHCGCYLIPACTGAPTAFALPPSTPSNSGLSGEGRSGNPHPSVPATPPGIAAC